MAFTFGFFDSVDGDRKYNAQQFSSIFDGIINDGVYQSIGDKFRVTADSGLTVNVGTGRAWLKRKWIYNSSPYAVTLDAANSQPRIDAITLTVNLKDSQRRAYIYVIKGTPAASPSRPSVDSGDNDIARMPLAYIRVPANATAISQSNITNAVGSSATPYVTGILQVTSIDNLVEQWREAWNEYIRVWQNRIDDDYSDWNDDRLLKLQTMEGLLNQLQLDIAAYKTAKENAIDGLVSDFATYKATKETRIDDSVQDFLAWMSQKESIFDTWFANLQIDLQPDQATNLANRIENVALEVTGLHNEIVFQSAQIAVPGNVVVRAGDFYLISDYTSSYIPVGYTAKAVTWEHASSYAYFTPTAIDLSGSGANQSVNIRVRNVGSEDKGLGYVKVTFICKKN